MITALIKIFFIAFALQGVPEETVSKAKDDFSKLNKVFFAEKFSVEMEYKLYENHFNTVPVETRSGYYFKSGKNDYSRIMDIETLHTPELTLVAMNEEKLITVSGPASQRMGLSVGPDTLLRFCKQIKFSDNQDTRKYELYFNENSSTEFNKIELSFDIKTYQLNKFIIYYNEREKILENGTLQMIKPKVEIAYKNYNKAKGTPEFSEGKYVTKIGANKYKSTGKYASYKVYNQKIK